MRLTGASQSTGPANEFGASVFADDMAVVVRSRVADPEHRSQYGCRRKESGMYIGLGTILLIILVVVLVKALR